MRSHLRLLSVAALAGSALAAHALVLLDTGTTTLASGDSLQTARLFRTGVASDWSGSKAFPGTSGSGTRHYKAYDVEVGLNNYVQVSTDDPNTRFIVSAYQTSYNGASLSTNYLGDAGSSGNDFGNMHTFQVIGALNSHVIVVVSEVDSNGGVGQNYRTIIEGFSDSMYSEAVPEPATLSILGLGALAAFRRRKA